MAQQNALRGLTFAAVGGILWVADQRGGDTRRAGPGVKHRVKPWTGGPVLFLLLAGQPVKLPAQLVRVVALGGKPGNFLEPLPELFDLHGKPGGLLRLLYQQFRDVRRVHVHLPFLDAAGVAAVRWAGAVWPGLVPDVSRWPRRRQDPENRSPRPPLGGNWGIIFAQNFRAVFGENGKSGNFPGAIASRISSEFFPAVGGL